jgi:hypothetical protein
MVEDGSLKVLRILSHASAVIAEGEVDQLTAQRQVETSEEHYLQIINAKTAALFAAACRISPVVAEAGEEAEEALEAYGRFLGIAFQLVDDAIDYASDAETMGKGQGDDFRDGKVTLPVILAYARGPAGFGACDWPDHPERRLVRHAGTGPPIWPQGDRRAGHVPGQPGQVGADRSGRVRRFPRLLI